MTPATARLDELELPYRTAEYEHDPDHGSYALEAAEALGISTEVVYKTLVCRTDGGELVVGVVPSDQHLDLKALARAAGVKRAELADVADAERATGYVAGGISPVGQRRALRTFVHEDAVLHDEIHVSGGRRGLEIVLHVDTLVTATGATIAPVAR